MSLNIGERYAIHFDVVGVLGSGGMGEVYRGHDIRLKRDVALKVLPDAVADKPDRLAQLQREAEVLASLNHPNIAQIHGIEEDGGTRALVLELVDGSTLEELVGRGPMPTDDALAIAAQLAEGLEAAHAIGVIHRDLKPANVMVGCDGTVKVLDFGLATALRAPGVREGPDDASTMDAPAALASQVAGTPAYMSPEQIRGGAVDRRTDVWAYGAVLFEMLTGRKAFDGDGVAATLAAVLESEPAWESLSGVAAPRVVGVLRRCLAKEPGERLRDIGDVRLGLAGAFEVPEAPRATRAEQRGQRMRRALELTGVAAVTAVVAAAAMWTDGSDAPHRPKPVQFEIETAPRSGRFLALSPDGQYLAYHAGNELGQGWLWLHSFATGEARAVPGAGWVTSPIFWSPDARFMAFGAGDILQRVDVASGVAAAVSDAAAFSGGSWNGDNVIVFGSQGGIMRVAAGGGRPASVTEVSHERGETAHVAPWFLPDDRHFLYLRASSNAKIAGIYVGALGVEPDAQDDTRLVASEQAAAYAPPRDSGTTGHLLFMQKKRLLSQPFDHRMLELVGDPVVVAEEVAHYDAWGSFSVSRNGSIAWRPVEATASVAWVGSTGKEDEAAAIRNLEDPRYPQLSPDGRRLALAVAGDIWVFDRGGRPPVKLTFDELGEGSPLWAEDGSYVVYEGDGSLYAASVDGSSTPTPVGPPGHFHPQAWSPNGDVIAIAISGDGHRLVEFSPSQDAVPRAVFESPYGEVTGAALSPDGRRLAYVSNATGRAEIWMRPYGGTGAALRVSPTGGTEPVWAGDGRTLYYLKNRTMMAVAVEASGEFGLPVRLFDGDHRIFHQPPSYDVTPDGRFVMVKSDDESRVSVIVNWPEPLRFRTAAE